MVVLVSAAPKEKSQAKNNVVLFSFGTRSFVHRCLLSTWLRGMMVIWCYSLWFLEKENSLTIASIEETEETAWDSSKCRDGKFDKKTKRFSWDYFFIRLFWITHLMAMYRQIAKVTVKDIDIVWSTWVKCIWNRRYTAQPYLKSRRSGEKGRKKRKKAHYSVQTPGDFAEFNLISYLFEFTTHREILSTCIWRRVCTRP